MKEVIEKLMELRSATAETMQEFFPGQSEYMWRKFELADGDMLKYYDLVGTHGQKVLVEYLETGKSVDVWFGYEW